MFKPLKIKIHRLNVNALRLIKSTQYLLAFTLIAVIFSACHHSENGKEEGQSYHNNTEEKQAQSKEGHSTSANEHMHSSSTEELIERFESAERDTYQQPEKVMDYLGDVQGMKIMDIGAGSGYFSVKLAKAGADVIAADVNDEFLAHIEQRKNKASLSNIELRKIPFDSPALEKAEVDMVLIVNTYHHIENRREYFKELKKGLKSEGHLLIIDFYKTELPVGPPLHHKVSLDVVLAELKDAGYTDI